MAEHSISRRRILANAFTATAALSVFGGCSAVAIAEPRAHLDAELFALRDELRAKHASLMNMGPSADEEMNVAADAHLDVLKRIVRVRARTLDGLRIKAEAIKTIHFDEAIYLGRNDTTDLLLVASIIGDLGFDAEVGNETIRAA